jgi:hypothetical protein
MLVRDLSTVLRFFLAYAATVTQATHSPLPKTLHRRLLQALHPTVFPLLQAPPIILQLQASLLQAPLLQAPLLQAPLPQAPILKAPPIMC